VKGLAGVVIALLLCVVGALPMAVGQIHKSVMFLAAPDVDFEPTSPHDFNDKFRPSFGWLPVYLEGTGYDVSWGEISSQDLSGVQIVVGINVRDNLNEDQQKPWKTLSITEGLCLSRGSYVLSRRISPV